MLVKKSALFMRQWGHYAKDYKERAGVTIAGKFITAVEEAINFIQ